MKKTGAAKKIDFVFLSLVLYLILFIVYYLIFNKALYCIGLSLFTLLFIYLIYFGATKNKREKQKLNIQQKNHCDSIYYNLPFLCADKINDWLKRLFEKAEYKIHLDKIVTAEKEGVKRNIYCCFGEAVQKENIYECERQRQESNSQGFILICDDISSQVSEMKRDLGGKYNIVFNRNDCYQIMNKFNEYPEILYNAGQKRKSVKKLFLYMFKRERFKSYFFLAAVMFLFSLVSPFKNYYLIFSAVLFLFSMFTIVSNKKGEKKDNNVII